MHRMRHLGSRAAFLFCYYFWKDPITCFSCPCLGPEIWLEYAQYSIGGIGQEGGIEKVRSIFERALTAVGLHVTKGTALWEAYREFENAILETAQVSPFPWAPIPKKNKKKSVVQLLESPGAVPSGKGPGICLTVVSFQPSAPGKPFCVCLADEVKGLFLNKILKSSQIQEQSLALLLVEVPRTALN